MKKFLKVLVIVLISITTVLGGFAAANGINSIVMNKYIDSFEKVAMENQLLPQTDEQLGYYFTTDRDFKVMHLTDIHIGGGVLSAGKDKKAINAVAAMITAEKPDLVVVTGDIAFPVPWAGTLNNAYAHGYFTRLMERLGVYYTVTFGNHDSESYNFYDRAGVAKMYDDESLSYCLFDRGPEDIFGECNHAITVRDTDGFITESLVMIDSNAYTDEDPLGLGWVYDCIHDDQIEWYESVTRSHIEYNESLYASLAESEKSALGGVAPMPQGLLFMHIPIREVKYAYDEYVNNGRQNTEDSIYVEGNDGEKDQVVYCSEIDEDLFETALSLGVTKAIFYGHDHLNNFVFNYKGITLSYGYSIDYLAYFGIKNQGYQRGSTVIYCRDGEPLIIHENYYQDKYPARYEKEAVDMTR